MKTASDSSRLVLLHFTATWCKPCQKLEQDVFTKPEVQQALAKGFVAAKVDLDANKDLAKQYNVTSIPADVILLPSGKFLYKVNCPPTAAEYAGQLGLVAEAGKKAWTVALATKSELSAAASAWASAAPPSFRSDQPYTTPNAVAGAGQVPLPQYASDSLKSAAGAATAGTQYASDNFNAYLDQRQKQHDTEKLAAAQAASAGTTPPFASLPGVNSAAGGLPNGANVPLTNSPWTTPSTANVNSQPAPWAVGAGLAASTTSVPPGNAVVNNNSLPAPTTAAANTNSAATTPPWATQAAARPGLGAAPNPTFLPGTAAANNAVAGTSQLPPAAGATIPPAPTRPAVQPTTVNNPFSRPNLPANQPATQPTVRPGQPSATLRPVAPVSSSGVPLGIGRLDPVRLCERQTPYDQVDERYGAEHRGRIYLFSGEAEQKKFLANPDAYAPVLSGNDVVQAFDAGRPIPGSPQYGEFCNNRIYLFSSPETRERFRKSPDRYQQLVQQAEAATGTVRR